MIVFWGGDYVPEEDATISIDDRGFLFSDAVFETALLYRGGFFRLRQHLERFAESARTMRIAAPSIDDVDGIVRAVVRRNDLRDANIRITLTRGVTAPKLLVTARAADPTRLEQSRAGWNIITAQTRRPSIRSIPAQLKAVGRTYALLARHEAADAGVDDVLLLTDDDFVCEGPTWNVFWRTGDTLYTPALHAGVLAGVTRSIILELASASGLHVREGLFNRTVLDEADEIFATMTSVGIVPIRTLDGRALPADTSAADALHSAYRDRLAAEAALDPL
jgi:branched-chain amino acid aminotransferase